MFKRVLKYIFYSLLFITLSAYFIHAANLTKRARESTMCTDIRIKIVDSLQNRFVTKDEIKEIILETKEVVGEQIDHIDLYKIENTINKKTAIKQTKAAIDRNGVMHIKVSQRRPIIRLQSSTTGAYVDEEGYIFPLTRSYTSYVPMITGNIPVDLTSFDTAELSEEEKKWINSIVGFGAYIAKNEIWGDQIQQINIEKGGDISFSTRVGEIDVMFGEMTDIENKFERLLYFYQHVIPTQGWEKYEAVNLKYDNQIICIERKK